MRTVLGYLRSASAGVRLLIVLSLALGVLYPLAVTALAQLPGLRSGADGSLAHADGRVVGSTLIGQNFTDAKGNPLPQYFQPRPSAAGDGYDPTASGASNLGPESIVDVLPDPTVKGDTGTQSLLTQVCTRSHDLGKRYGVDGRRPYCTDSGVGAVLAVFYSGPGYHGRITRVVSLNQAAPTLPFLATYRGVRGAAGPLRRGLLAREGRRDPRYRPEPPGGTGRRGDRVRLRAGPGHQPGLRASARTIGVASARHQ